MLECFEQDDYFGSVLHINKFFYLFRRDIGKGTTEPDFVEAFFCTAKSFLRLLQVGTYGDALT